MSGYDMTLTMLSPVHVGSGEEIEPTAYVVRQHADDKGTYQDLYALDLPRLLGRFTDEQRRRFNDAADRGGTVYLRKFIEGVADLQADVRWKATCDPDLYERYQQGLQSDHARLVIYLMTRDAITGRPYLPGSSIKGALRTAWINRKIEAYAKRENYAGRENLERIPEKRSTDLEAEVLGYRVRRPHGPPRAEIRADPFRAVRVGDAPLCDDSNAVDPVQIYKPDRTARQPDPSGIQMFYDMTFNLLDGDAITARGRLHVDERLAATRTPDQRGWDFDRCVSDAITADALLEACNDFYKPRLEDELQRFARVRQNAERLLDFVGQMRTGEEALIRLGRFSHRECVTVSRSGGRPEPRSKGTTRSLAGGELPMGWAKIALKRR